MLLGAQSVANIVEYYFQERGEISRVCEPRLRPFTPEYKYVQVSRDKYLGENTPSRPLPPPKFVPPS